MAPSHAFWMVNCARIPILAPRRPAVADVSLEMIQILVQRSLDGQTSLRREVNEIRSLLLAVVDQGRRTERRVGELRDEID